MMKMSNLVLAVSLLASTSAFAKVTVFSNVEATQQLLDSAQFKGLLADQSAQLSQLTVTQRDDSNAFQAFEFSLTYVSSTPIGPRSCQVRADVFVVRDVAAPAGITATKLSSPVLQSPICEK